MYNKEQDDKLKIFSDGSKGLKKVDSAYGSVKLENFKQDDKGTLAGEKRKIALEVKAKIAFEK